MTTLSKTLLVVSVTGFVAGSVIDFGGFNLNPSWTVALPLGAVSFGLFLISFMLEKEMVGFDEDEAKKCAGGNFSAYSRYTEFDFTVNC
jgi:hypothetical protein